MLTFLKKFFGTKSEKDIKSIQPIVDKIIEIYPSLKSLSNDELRAKVSALKQKVQDAVKKEQAEVDAIKARVEKEFDLNVETKEALYKEVESWRKRSPKR